MSKCDLWTVKEKMRSTHKLSASFVYRTQQRYLPTTAQRKEGDV